MGMFDTIDYEKTTCAECGAPLGDYQSKGGNCELQLLTPQQLLEQSNEEKVIFYAYCNDDGWNNHDKPRHYNEFVVLAPRPLQVVRANQVEVEL